MRNTIIVTERNCNRYLRASQPDQILLLNEATQNQDGYSKAKKIFLLHLIFSIASANFC